MSAGIVFDIMKYSVHDGPGIRTTVFLKGCPLRCAWCHNPESWLAKPEIMFFEERCIGCGDCVAVCPNVAFGSKDGVPVFQRDKCTACGNCAEVCHAGAREMAGRGMTVDEVLAEIDRDVIFYDQSGGGVTFSGGEPLLQPEFLLELLAECKKKGIHTAVDTTGFAPPDRLLQAGEITDLFLYDLKIMNDRLHRRYTGVSNRLILDNLRELAARHGDIVIRIPVIPGVNDEDENINETGRFVSTLAGVRYIHLLPYHRAGADKYRRLGLEYSLADLRPPGDEKMKAIAEKLGKYGLMVRIGH